MGNGLSDHHFLCLPSFQALHIVILGLDCAGKTTVLYRLRFNEFVNTVPTKGFNAEKIKVSLGSNRRTASFHFWDVGGQEKLRPLWRSTPAALTASCSWWTPSTPSALRRPKRSCTR
uniref:ADP-ribosylation factor-like 4ab n=1 Tax=Labrus bergylta TaxID=56723 RepID=A0A3Q3H0V2_9LABR